MDLPKSIADDAQKVADIVENIGPKIKNCGTAAIDNCESRGKTLLAKISLCVAKKIVH